MDPRIQLTHQMVRLIGLIDEFKGRWNARQTISKSRLKRLHQKAAVESIGSSTRIEGSKLTNDQVAELIKREPMMTKSRDEDEVAGYAKTLVYVYESHPSLDLSETCISNLHDRLLFFSDRDEPHRGRYKTRPNHVEAFNHEGNRLGVTFETTLPEETPAQIKELIDWAGGALAGDKLHPLIVIPVFDAHFLAIRPFQSGNGRLSRILTSLLLIQAGYTHLPYVSLENMIEKRPERYFISLRAAQATLQQNEPQYGDWIGFFLETLRQQQVALQLDMDVTQSI